MTDSPSPYVADPANPTGDEIRAAIDRGLANGTLIDAEDFFALAESDAQVLRRDVALGDGRAWLVRYRGQHFAVSTSHPPEGDPEHQVFRCDDRGQVSDWDDVASGSSKVKALVALTARPVDESGRVLSARDVLDAAEAAEDEDADRDRSPGKPGKAMDTDTIVPSDTHAFKIGGRWYWVTSVENTLPSGSQFVMTVPVAKDPRYAKLGWGKVRYVQTGRETFKVRAQTPPRWDWVTRRITELDLEWKRDSIREGERLWRGDLITVFSVTPAGLGWAVLNTGQTVDVKPDVRQARMEAVRRYMDTQK